MKCAFFSLGAASWAAALVTRGQHDVSLSVELHDGTMAQLQVRSQSLATFLPHLLRGAACSHHTAGHSSRLQFERRSSVINRV